MSASAPTQKLDTLINRHRRTLTASALLATLGAGLGLVPYYLAYRIAVEILAQPIESINAQSVWFLAGGAVIAILGKAACNVFSLHLSHIAAYTILYDTRIALANKLGTLPLGFFGHRTTGTIKKVVHEDVENLEEGLAHMVPDIVSGLATPLLAVVSLAFVDWRMALAAFIMIPVTIMTFALVMGGIYKKMVTFNDLMARLNGMVIQYINGMKVIKAFTRTDVSFENLKQVVDDTHSFYMTISRRIAWRYPIVSVMVRANLITILPLGLLLYLSGSLTLPTLILFLLVGMGLNQAVFKVFWHSGTAYYQVNEAIKRVNALLQETSLSEPTQPMQPEGYAIALENVTFAYDDEQVLNGISFAVAPGTVTALVGPSGAGKSTIAKLIPRFWDVSGGSIRIGGVDVRHMPLETLMEQVAFVFQDVFLFNDTVYENIRVGKPSATEAEIMQAAKLARVDDFVQTLEGGYQYAVGENGAKLSGGQRQRISIARAILKDAPIIVLDEATASIDPENERLVQQAFNALTANKTLIVIAHRLNTVQFADKIIVLDAGRVAQEGTHSDLIAQPGLYRRFWEERQKARGWKLSANRTSDSVLA